jgi:hypothetical protein
MPMLRPSGRPCSFDDGGALSVGGLIRRR